MSINPSHQLTTLLPVAFVGLPIMKPFSLLFFAFMLHLVQGYLVSPPGVVAPGAPDQCSGWSQGSAGSTCHFN
jgi:hypothetical protein